ncbi:MAG: stage III sporulation protein AB [Oscillospiraceae bacterium]|jgi:stage III sporulation protein AA|nr:stage III sporulation protein AB [Oscillospiraceae bacterium]
MEARLKKYFEAAEFLPPELRKYAHLLSDREKETAEEFRLRRGQPFAVSFGGAEYVPDAGKLCTAEHIAFAVSGASKGSLHAVCDSLRNGYITAEGGHRLGVCGSAVIKDGGISAIKTFSSVSLRIAKEIIGAGKEVFEYLSLLLPLQNALIISPPGGGKTTLLRDVVRLFSNSGARVSVADERGEIAAMADGVSGFDLGPRTDVMDGCGKADGAMMLLRTMSPQIIALDEITDPKDIAAVENAGGCGVAIIATCHAYSGEELKSRALYPELKRLFEYVVLLEGGGEDRRVKITRMSEL